MENNPRPAKLAWTGAEGHPNYRSCFQSTTSKQLIKDNTPSSVQQQLRSIPTVVSFCAQTTCSLYQTQLSIRFRLSHNRIPNTRDAPSSPPLNTLYGRAKGSPPPVPPSTPLYSSLTQSSTRTSYILGLPQWALLRLITIYLRTVEKRGVSRAHFVEWHP
jgi:hypothetical protein